MPISIVVISHLLGRGPWPLLIVRRFPTWKRWKHRCLLGILSQQQLLDVIVRKFYPWLGMSSCFHSACWPLELHEVLISHVIQLEIMINIQLVLIGLLTWTIFIEVPIKTRTHRNYSSRFTGFAKLIWAQYCQYTPKTSNWNLKMASWRRSFRTWIFVRVQISFCYMFHHFSNFGICITAWQIHMGAFAKASSLVLSYTDFYSPLARALALFSLADVLRSGRLQNPSKEVGERVARCSSTASNWCLQRLFDVDFLVGWGERGFVCRYCWN